MAVHPVRSHSSDATPSGARAPAASGMGNRGFLPTHTKSARTGIIADLTHSKQEPTDQLPTHATSAVTLRSNINSSIGRSRWMIDDDEYLEWVLGQC